MNLKWILSQLLVIIGVYANVYSQNFTVENYDVSIYINAEGYFDVIENYDIDFKVPKHGIYRKIQTQYDLRTEHGNIEKRDIIINNIKVANHPFEVSSKFEQRINGETKIKIGDADKTIIGPVHYEIQYRVENAFLFEENGIKFYWNIKPPNWEEAFKKITFSIHVPENIDFDQGDVKVYSGEFGSIKESLEFEVEIVNHDIRGTSVDDFSSNLGESVTVLLDLPTSSIKEVKPLWPFWNKYGWTIILSALALIFYRLFKKFGKDDPAPMSISYFPPENLDPSMAGFLIDDRQNTTDLIALIPHWGTEGYLKIEEIDYKSWLKKDTLKLIKLKDLPNEVPNYQKTMFNGLFTNGATEVLVSSLKDKFYKTMETAKKQLHGSAQVYYESKSRKAFFNIGWGIVLIHLLIIPFFLYQWGIMAMVSGIISFIILLVLNRYMIKKNKLGIQLYSELKGFRQFIKTAETARIKMLLNENPNYFEAIMAYALAFGSFKTWAEKFDSLDIQPPSWYHSSNNNFTFNNFSNSFTKSMSEASTTMVSSPSSSSSGGGSSGGGFGGGGGGSW